ncbi:cytoskeleton-associated protein 2-like [Engraulis encrasicolus]|uniref:cytoskeleton-associated protein 2-like n=1 Tax=Engraulis encrasicolus TaxID=184585 RepID=UPI002FD483CC
MEGAEVEQKLSGPELRKQKLMEYLASKGRLKPPNPKPYLRHDLDPKKGGTVKTTNNKENQVTHKHTGPEATTHTQKARCAMKAKLPDTAPGKRAPLAAANNNSNASVRNQFMVKGPDAVTAAYVGGKAQSGPVRRQPSKSLQPALSERGKALPGKAQPGQNKQGTAAAALPSQGRCSSSLSSRASSCASTKPPAFSTLRSLAASQPLQSRPQAQKKPQQVLKFTLQRDDSAGTSSRVTVPKSSIINSRQPQTRSNSRSRSSEVTCNQSKTAGQQTRKSTSSANCSVKCVKPAEKMQRRTISSISTTSTTTTSVSHGSSKAGGLATSKSKLSAQNNTQAKNPPWGARLQSGRLNDHQRVTLPCRRPPSSQATTSRAGTTASQASAAQAKTARAVVPSAGTQREVTASKTASFSLPPSKSALRRRPTTAPVMDPEMAPLFGKSIAGPSLVTEGLKTPVARSRPQAAIPATEPMTGGAKKPTAAQAERLRKLQEWREAKGITYKRPPMTIKKSARKSIVVPEHYWASMEEEDENQRLAYAVDRALNDCLDLLHMGCSTEQVLGVLSRIPMAHKFCKYWMCRARLMEREGNLEVLPMFEEAVRVVREPINDLRAVIFEILKKKDAQTNSANDEEVAVEEAAGDNTEVTEEEGTGDAPPATPKNVNVLIRAAKGGSSVVKYKITATPNGRGSQHREPLRYNGQELRFFTPVRRSVRIENSAPRYPSALRERDPCVASAHELPPAHADTGSSPIYVYMENEALKDQVQVQLFQEEEEEEKKETGGLEEKETLKDQEEEEGTGGLEEKEALKDQEEEEEEEMHETGGLEEKETFKDLVQVRLFQEDDEETREG